MKADLFDDSDVTAVASWFGSNRMLAEHVGHELRGCDWVGVGFGGGMCELAHIDARTINVNDKHFHVVNLARVIADPVLGPKLYRQLRRLVFHPTVLISAQNICRHALNHPEAIDGPLGEHHLGWAVSYFVCAWMTRHATAGTPSEFTAGISTRWTCSGGEYGSDLASLRAAGYLNGFALTEAGEAAVQDCQTSIEGVLAALPDEPKRRLFRTIADAHGEPFTRDTLADAMGIHPNGGRYGSDLAWLRTMGVITERGPIELTEGAQA